MLIEIKCDKFVENKIIRPAIVFHEGLNTILGTDVGTNSIGKSTFLLIVDFVFGGEDYPKKAVDVIKNVGAHTIQFLFRFDGKEYYFSRSTDTSTMVNKCDSSYCIESKMTLDEFRKFLSEKYGIRQKGLSFRSAVSRFIRVAQKDNTNPAEPLYCGYPENGSEIVESIERLFDKFDSLESAKVAIENLKKEKKIFKDASAYGFVSRITKSQAKDVEAEIKNLKMAQNQFDDQELLVAKSNDEIKRITGVKDILQKKRSEKSRLETRKQMLECQVNGVMPVFKDDFKELKTYFPDANLKKLSDIECFHQKLTSILISEITEELTLVSERIKGVSDDIKNLVAELETFDIPSGISKNVLKRYADIEGKIKEKTKILEDFQRECKITDNIKSLSVNFEKLSTSVTVEIEDAINSKMREFDANVYPNGKFPPVFRLNNKGYSFFTPHDNGTGTAYKSLIVFDLTILALTNLPVVMHDSLLIKNIGDEPIDEILKLYLRLPKKQCFVAIDKVSSYPVNSQKILNDSAVLKLAGEESALFGRCWSIKDNGEENQNGL